MSDWNDICALMFPSWIRFCHCGGSICLLHGFARSPPTRPGEIIVLDDVHLQPGEGGIKRDCFFCTIAVHQRKGQAEPRRAQKMAKNETWYKKRAQSPQGRLYMAQTTPRPHFGWKHFQNTSGHLFGRLFFALAQRKKNPRGLWTCVALLRAHNKSNWTNF